ncbi:hypothetical protein GCM10009549_20340 [Streptomyces thermoalcalitolerans]|uniref:AMP-binding enzyme C-terminal domain-containing protein n=1 Tax=Streptomyces thermoalcalitolerans TaxID=65605 RepID=A0ABN1NKJ8_9ACTN
MTASRHRPGATGETVPAARAAHRGNAHRGRRPAARAHPRRAAILPDAPKAASGKILRRELRSREHGSE